MHTPLELIVDEAIPGHFYWTAVRPSQSGEPSVVIDYAKGPFPTEKAATDAGSAGLRAHQPGNGGGPRVRSSHAAAFAETAPAALN